MPVLAAHLIAPENDGPAGFYFVELGHLSQGTIFVSVVEAKDDPRDGSATRSEIASGRAANIDDALDIVRTALKRAAER